MVNAKEALAAGARYHEAGQWAEAERLYREVLRDNPTHAEALFRLGTMVVQAGQVPAGIQLLSAAIDSDRWRADFHVNLGEAFRRLGDLTQAIRSTQQAIALDPDQSPAHANLGLIREQQGNLPAAVASYREVARLAPDDAQAQIVLGRGLFQLGQHAEAEACFRGALSLAPQDPRMHFQLGVALHDQGKLDEAVACYERALELKPDAAEVRNSLGAIFQSRRDFAEAESQYLKAIASNPNYAEAHNNLGAVLVDQQRKQEALPHFIKATQLNPNVAQAFSNLAGSLLELGQLDNSIAASRRALALSPNLAVAHRNLGMCLQLLGQTDDAIAAFREAVRLDPANARQHGTLLYTLNFHPDYDAATLFAEHRDWAARHADPLTAESAPHANDRTPGRRLRVGYVSPYFVAHAVNFFIEPILAAHDHDAFEVFCYAHVARPDDTTARLQGYADHWRDISGQTDEQAAATIRRDAIDILVDLSGHIIDNRLMVFAHKPAPVQVSYLGYQNTTGMLAMDYRLTDAWSDPPGTNDPFHTESLVRMPGSFFTYQPTADAPPPGPLPALANGYVTFGSFNFFGKITPRVLDAWAGILRRVERSRLLLLAPESKSLKQYILSCFEAQGIADGRVEVCSMRPRSEYLEFIRTTDIALDPFPFNGHTTTCDALWMGVPVVTLAGERYATRFGSSALVQLGLKNWIAESPEQYIATAAKWAADRDGLARLRAELRDRMAASPLVDGQTFTRNLEAEIQRMWKLWCDRSSSPRA